MEQTTRMYRKIGTGCQEISVYSMANRDALLRRLNNPWDRPYQSSSKHGVADVGHRKDRYGNLAEKEVRKNGVEIVSDDYVIDHTGDIPRILPRDMALRNLKRLMNYSIPEEIEESEIIEVGFSHTEPFKRIAYITTINAKREERWYSFDSKWHKNCRKTPLGWH